MLLQTPWSTLSIKCNYKSEWGRASANSDRNVGAGLRFSVTKLKLTGSFLNRVWYDIINLA